MHPGEPSTPLLEKKKKKKSHCHGNHHHIGKATDSFISRPTRKEVSLSFVPHDSLGPRVCLSFVVEVEKRQQAESATTRFHIQGGDSIWVVISGPNMSNKTPPMVPLNGSGGNETGAGVNDSRDGRPNTQNWWFRQRYETMVAVLDTSRRVALRIEAWRFETTREGPSGKDGICSLLFPLHLFFFFFPLRQVGAGVWDLNVCLRESRLGTTAAPRETLNRNTTSGGRCIGVPENGENAERNG